MKLPTTPMTPRSLPWRVLDGTTSTLVSLERLVLIKTQPPPAYLQSRQSLCKAPTLEKPPRTAPSHRLFPPGLGFQHDGWEKTPGIGVGGWLLLQPHARRALVASPTPRSSTRTLLGAGWGGEARHAPLHRRLRKSSPGLRTPGLAPKGAAGTAPGCGCAAPASIGDLGGGTSGTLHTPSLLHHPTPRSPPAPLARFLPPPPSLVQICSPQATFATPGAPCTPKLIARFPLLAP